MTETQGAEFLNNCLPKILNRLFCNYLHPLVQADEVSRMGWQLVTAIQDEGDDLTLCD